MINLYDSARYRLDRPWLLQTMQSYLDLKRVSPHLTINCIFVGRRKMLHIATTYKHEPEALPVLCFPYITSKRMIFKSDISASTDTPPMTIDSRLSTVDSPPTSLTLSPPDLLGEIFICYPQAVLLAAEKNKKVDDMMTFLLHHAIDNLLLGKEGTYYQPTI